MRSERNSGSGPGISHFKKIGSKSLFFATGKGHGVKSLSLNSFERDELHYTLDPKDIYGPAFPGETFRVLKEKEEREYGEYQMRRLILDAWFWRCEIG